MRLQFLFYMALLGILSISCVNRLPSKYYTENDVQIKGKVVGDSLFVNVNNTLKCPLQIYLESDSANFSSISLIAKPLLNQELRFDMPIHKKSVRILWAFGNPEEVRNPKSFALPFPKGKTYRIIQGYGGSFSHQGIDSRYAIDFSLKIKDTVCAVANGYVVGVIKDYKKGGIREKWTPYANYITLYHPESGLFTQYVHLVYNGSLVKVGDSVVKGQVIGFSGKTGYTNTEHLHFNVLKPEWGKRRVSTPIEFEAVKGEELEQGILIENK